MTYTITPVTFPADLASQKNGKLGPCQLVSVFFPGVGHASMHHTAARAWGALSIACLNQTGQTLTAVSVADVYRSYDRQLALFLSRYTPDFLPLRNVLSNRRTGPDGKSWYKRIGVAACASPGTSNHGWGLAIDMALFNPNINDGDAYMGDPVGITSNRLLFAWLQLNAGLYGFSWESQDEAWHIRYVAGDKIPQRVLDMEAFFAGLPKP